MSNDSDGYLPRKCTHCSNYDANKLVTFIDNTDGYDVVGCIKCGNIFAATSVNKTETNLAVSSAAWSTVIRQLNVDAG